MGSSFAVMYEETLREIGLSQNEAKLYENMLQLGETSVHEIALKAGVHRRNAYDSLAKLTEKGLVAQFVIKGEKHFKATNPERLLTLLKDKEDRLNSIMPAMKQRFHNIKAGEQAYIYRGVQGFRNYMQDILDTGQDFYAIGAKGGWFDPRLKAFRLRFYKELKKKKLNAYHLFDHEMREYAQLDKDSPVHYHKSQARFLPPGASTNAAIDFFGDHVVPFTGLNINRLDDDMMQFVLVSQDLADAMRKWFWVMWEGAKS